MPLLASILPIYQQPGESQNAVLMGAFGVAPQNPKSPTSQAKSKVYFQTGVV
jgi:hypothetical protein